MTNLAKISYAALLILASQVAQVQAQPAGDCVMLSNGQACVITTSPRTYGVGPKGEAPKLVYKDCDTKDSLEFICYADGVEAPRLFVHRKGENGKTGKLFAAKQPNS